MKTLLAEAAHPGLNIQDWLTLEPRERRETADSFPQDPFAPYCSRGWLKGEPAGRSLRFDEIDLLNRSVCFCFKTNVTSCFFFGHSFLSYLEVVGRSRRWSEVVGSVRNNRKWPPSALLSICAGGWLWWPIPLEIPEPLYDQLAFSDLNFELVTSVLVFSWSKDSSFLVPFPTFYSYSMFLVRSLK